MAFTDFLNKRLLSVIHMVTEGGHHLTKTSRNQVPPVNAKLNGGIAMTPREYLRRTDMPVESGLCFVVMPFGDEMDSMTPFELMRASVP
jgi:hypothetical protein